MKYAIFEPTPVEAVTYIQNLIKDKVVYDIGAGDGKFALAMTEYAKKVVAVESDEMYAGDCVLRGLETINTSFLNIPLYTAEVIFIFMSSIGNYALTHKLQDDNWHGTVISHYYPLMNSPTDLIKEDQLIDIKLPGLRLPFLVYNI